MCDISFRSQSTLADSFTCVPFSFKQNYNVGIIFSLIVMVILIFKLNIGQRNLVSFIAFLFFEKAMRERGPNLTFVRLCTSNHLRDLQQIASFTLVIAAILTFSSLYFPDNSFSKVLSLSAVASTAAAILNYTYQIGSKRIGSVDLFANEISVICRVFLIVEFAATSVSQASSHTHFNLGVHTIVGHSDLKSRFVSQEQYAPVYDKNFSDLQPFDVDVVASVTRFYTYRKTMMDYLRVIGSSDENDMRADLRTQMIYMQFLMYESARDAVERLVEFEPNQAETLIYILCSELILFSFLKKRFENDFKGKRLAFRIDDYKNLIKKISDQMNSQPSLNWIASRATFPELIKRYDAMRKDLSLQ